MNGPALNSGHGAVTEIFLTSTIMYTHYTIINHQAFIFHAILTHMQNRSVIFLF